MTKNGIIFLIIAVVFFALGTIMYIIQKIISNRLYNEGETVEEPAREEKKKIDKLNTPEDIDTSLLDEIAKDDEEEDEEEVEEEEEL